MACCVGSGLRRREWLRGSNHFCGIGLFRAMTYIFWLRWIPISFDCEHDLYVPLHTPHYAPHFSQRLFHLCTTTTLQLPSSKSSLLLICCHQLLVICYNRWISSIVIRTTRSEISHNQRRQHCLVEISSPETRKRIAVNVSLEFTVSTKFVLTFKFPQCLILEHQINKTQTAGALKQGGPQSGVTIRDMTPPRGPVMRH